MRGRLLVLALGVLAAPALVEAQATAWLRNTDPTAAFAWWAVATAVGPADTVLTALQASGPAHLVEPGERVAVGLGPGQTLVGAFVEARSVWGTPVTGGFLTADQLPPRGTLQVSRTTFAAANRGRALSAPLEAWGLSPRPLVLDGDGRDWSAADEVWRGGEAWLAARGLPETLALRAWGTELWFRLEGRPASLAGARLVARFSGGRVVADLATAGPLWYWPPEGEALAVGSVRLSGAGVVEGRWAWDRLPPDRAQAWTTDEGGEALVWSIEGPTPAVLGAWSRAELP